MLKSAFPIFLLAAIPVLLWYDPSLGVNQFFNLLSVGQLAGLTGAILLSINFILSSRAHFLESLFGGLNKVFMLHHKNGVWAFTLLSIHPLAIFLSSLRVSIEFAINSAFPNIFVDQARWFGIFAYIVLATLIALTLYIKLPYHLWRLTHKFMGLVLILAFLHVYLIPSTVSYNQPLRLYMLTLMGVGISFYFYRTILGKLLVKKYLYKVKSVKRDGKIVKITLTAEKRKIKYMPGQFIFVEFFSDKVKSEDHPFSLTSSPNDSFISFSAKSLGDYTNTLSGLNEGDLAKIEGPFGEFSYLNSPKNNQIWIAGGIGITPYVSMAKSLTKKQNLNIHLYYATGKDGNAVHKKDLSEMAKKYTNFKFTIVQSKNGGRITAHYIKGMKENFDKSDIFICGPNQMMKNLRRQFNTLGVGHSRIFTEEFSLEK